MLLMSNVTDYSRVTCGPVSGSYTIPAFHHCLLNTLLLNLTIPGPGNTLNLTLGQLQLG